MKKNEVERAVEKISCETANVKEETKVLRIELKEWHSRKYLKEKLETTYKGKEVVFILPNGKEFVYEEPRKGN